MTNCEEDKESMNNLSRQRLYNQLNEDILVYSSADYFLYFKTNMLMMVESAKKKAKIQIIREQLEKVINSAV